MSANLVNVKKYLTDYIIKYLGYNPFDYNKYDTNIDVYVDPLTQTSSCATTDVKLDFTDIETSSCENSNDPNNFRIWLKSFLASEKSKDLAEHYYFSSLFRKFGYLTFKYLLMFTNPISRQMLFDGSITSQNDIQAFDEKNNYINKFIKFETLDNDIDKILKILGINFNEKLDKLNVSKRVTETDFYFDTETKDLVWKYDEYIFLKHNYKY